MMHLYLLGHRRPALARDDGDYDVPSAVEADFFHAIGEIFRGVAGLDGGCR
jgi:hypothetical protein